MHKFRQVPLARPYITPEDKSAVMSVLEGTTLSIGDRVEAFEASVARFVGAKHAIAVNSGTSALHLCIRSGILLHGLRPNDLVITSPFTFMATVSCFMQEGLIPYFVDVQPDTCNVDMEVVMQVAERVGAKAMIIPDIFGIMPKYRDAYPGMFFVEDSAEALGASLNGRMAGTFGDAGVFAFYGNKQVTTGEGGMVVTDNSDIAQLCRSMRNQGRSEDPQKFDHRVIGYNYRMAELPAALGVSQMRRVDTIIADRRDIIAHYQAGLSGFTGARLVSGLSYDGTSPFVCAVCIGSCITTLAIPTLIHTLRGRGVGCRNYFPHLTAQQAVRDYGFMSDPTPVSQAASIRTLALPLFEGMSGGDIRYVCAVLKEEVDRLSNGIRRN